MKPVLPPDFKPPWWATREFRIYLILAVMGVAVIGVMVFEIGPLLTQRAAKPERPRNPNAFVPQPAAPGEPRVVRFEGVLEKVKDGTSMDDRDDSYQYLVKFLARADVSTVSKDSKPVDYPYFSKLPAELRGQTVKILALFLQSSPLRLDREVGGVQWVHRTYLSDLSGDQGYVVDLLEPPPAGLKQRSVVGMDAVFLKLGTYEGKRGPVQAPLFLGKALHPVKERMAAEPAVTGGLVVGVAAMALLLLIVLSANAFRNKSKPTPPRGPSISLETLKS